MNFGIRYLLAWLLVGGLDWLLVWHASEHRLGTASHAALLVAVVLAAWLTACAVISQSKSRTLNVLCLTGTICGWSVLWLLLEMRVEDGAMAAATVGAVLIASIASTILAARRQKIQWSRWVGEVSMAIGFIGVVGGVALATDTWRTRQMIRRAEARWSAVGLPIDRFDHTARASHETAGSAVVREVFRREINATFYKPGGTKKVEPPIEVAPATCDLLKEVSAFQTSPVPPADDIRPVVEPLILLTAKAETLDQAYREILAAEPAGWETDPRDATEMAVPNFLAIRQFAQIASADCLLRLAHGDVPGGTRAIDATLHMRRGLIENPTLVSLMIASAVDGLLASRQAQLPAAGDGFASISHDAQQMRQELASVCNSKPGSPSALRPAVNRSWICPSRR